MKERVPSWKRTAVACILWGGAIVQLHSAQSTYHFEVVSIKLNRTGGSSAADFLPGGRIRGRNLSVRNMIQMATMVEDNQMIGIPAWTATESYDIDGKTVSAEPVT